LEGVGAVQRGVVLNALRRWALLKLKSVSLLSRSWLVCASVSLLVAKAA
jgi:hypothetical protein